MLRKSTIRYPPCQDDLAHIAQIYWREKGQIALEFAVEDFYQSYAGLTTEVHRQLATLPLSLCIDISHVDFMATALGALGKTPTLGFYRLQKEHPTTLIDTTPQRSVLGRCRITGKEIKWLTIKANLI